MSKNSSLVSLIQSFAPEEGAQTSPVPGVYCLKFSQPDISQKRPWRACLAIVAQGQKEFCLAQKLYICEPESYTLTPFLLPVTSRVSEANPETPFLGLLIDLDRAMLSEVAAWVLPSSRKSLNVEQRPVYSGKTSQAMFTATQRIAELFETPEDANVLGRIRVKELLYQLCKEPNGEALLQYLRCHERHYDLYQVIHYLESNLNTRWDIAMLAQTANMSRSLFFQRFRELTSMSPVQYQKRLRLLEAKRLLCDEDESVWNAAYRVGYKSTSHFSREYRRMFGDSPMRHATKVKT